MPGAAEDCLPLLESVLRLARAEDLPTVLQELADAAEGLLGFERIRFYLAILDSGVLRCELRQGVDGPGDVGSVPLLHTNLLGRVALDGRGPMQWPVDSLQDTIASEGGIPTCFVPMRLPDALLGVLVADSPQQRREVTDASLRTLAMLSEFALLMVEHTRREQSRTRFVGWASHELRTPLTSINAFTEMLLDGDAGPLNEKQTRFVQRVLGSTEQLHRIVQDLLELARLEAGEEPITLTNVAIKPFLEDTAQNMFPQASAKDITLKVEAQDGLSTLRTDERRLRQALSNFIDNAIKYSPRETLVRVVAEATDGQLRLSVIDQGPGISPRDQKQLFTEFFRCYRGEESLRDRGSGLGLPIVQRLAQALGSAVEVESAVGQGSKFSLVFPAA